MRNFSTAGSQIWHQLLAILIMLGIALVGGSAIATILKFLDSAISPPLKVEQMYDDSGDFFFISQL